MNSGILHLTLKKHWFDLISSGEKKEEYRDIKPYWIRRFMKPEFHNLKQIEFMAALTHRENYRNDWHTIEFRNGYGNKVPRMLVEFKGIHWGYPKQAEWVANCLSPFGTWYFCLELGNVISISQ